MMMAGTDKNVSVIKASHKLQLKVGVGTIDAKTIAKSQHVIDTNEVDFAPVGLAILEKLNAGLQAAGDPAIQMRQVKAILTAPVMELKANAAIFHYALIGNLANIMLSFLEALDTLDKDAIDIVQAHHNTLHMIIVRKMRGDGGEAGKLLTRELQQACNRYYHRKFKHRPS